MFPHQVQPAVPKFQPPPAAAMIKSIQHNNPHLHAMATPFFVDNLLHHHHHKANFQSQFVHSYIQEQQHQFMLQQNHLRQHHHPAFKYEEGKKSALELLTGYAQERRNSENATPPSEDGSAKIDFDDEDNAEKIEKASDDIDEKMCENREENSRSADEYGEESPLASPVRLSVKNEFNDYSAYARDNEKQEDRKSGCPSCEEYCNCGRSRFIGREDEQQRTRLVDSGGQDRQPQKPILKFSVSAILGEQCGQQSDRNIPTSAASITHHDGTRFVGYGGQQQEVFAVPLPALAKPIASRPPAFPHLHTLLAHCRQHPYLAVGGGGAPGHVGFLGGGGGGGGFPWAGGPRGKPRRGMMRRAVFSDTQRRGLERRFQLQKYISKPDRKKLAEKLGLKDSQVKIWFQNRRMKWRNSKERELLASGGSREQTLPNKNNPHPDLSDAEVDRHKQQTMAHETPPPHSEGGAIPYALVAADDAMAEDYDTDGASNSDEEINVT